MKYAVTISKTVFIDDVLVELALIAGQKMVDAGEGLISVEVEQCE